MTKPLKGKTAIVTGAAAPRGIGRAAAHRLAADGAAVVVTDIAARGDGDDRGPGHLDRLAEIVDRIESNGGRALALEADVTDGVQIQQCLQNTLKTLGSIDVLVNNAGTTVGTGPFLESTYGDWERSFQVNLLGPMKFCQAVIPHFREAGGGVIVNVGSTGSLGAEGGFGAYTAMKHGVIGLTKTIAAEFGPEGIRCNAVCPGYTMTDMHMGANTRIAGERGLSVEAVMEQRYAGVALRRAGTPEEVADAIAYLAGPASSYVTGVALPAAGGLPFGL